MDLDTARLVIRDRHRSLLEQVEAAGVLAAAPQVEAEDLLECLRCGGVAADLAERRLTALVGGQRPAAPKGSANHIEAWRQLLAQRRGSAPTAPAVPRSLPPATLRLQPIGGKLRPSGLMGIALGFVLVVASLAIAALGGGHGGFFLLEIVSAPLAMTYPLLALALLPALWGAVGALAQQIERGLSRRWMGGVLVVHYASVPLAAILSWRADGGRAAEVLLYPDGMALGLAAMAVYVLFNVLAWREFVRGPVRARLRRGCCPACGYDLRGTAPEQPCPECGAARP